MKREDEFTEYKKTTAELNQSMISISAILNKHRKGSLYFGLKNDGTPFPFTITDSTIRDVSRKIFESIRPQIFPTITAETAGGTEIIRVEFSGDDVPYSAFGRYYIRIADEDRELTPSELRSIMINREYEDHWETRISTETPDDVDDAALEKFYHRAVSCGRMPEMANYDKEALLEKLDLLLSGRLTNAGKVLFSRNKPLVLKLAVFATDHKTTFLDIAREEGNIFTLTDRAMRYIAGNIRWRVTFDGGSLERQEIPEIPIDALREAVINSFVHARYDLPVQHEIDIFSNRIAILNPGSFASEFTPVDYAKKDLHSFLRNEQIANTLYLCKDVESFGSGLKKIYSSCADTGVSVSYQNAANFFMLEFSRADRNKEFAHDTSGGERKDTESSAGSSSAVSYRSPEESLSPTESRVRDLLIEYGHMTSAQLAEKSGKSRRTISRATTSLQEKKLIERVGSKKTGYWHSL